MRELRYLNFVVPTDSYRDLQLENRRFYSYCVMGTSLFLILNSSEGLIFRKVYSS
jgi:hypothetical protein